ncbi:MAG: MFS transporter [Chlorobi bacterium]|nr:MFS transporter [Chlorobiota bacterium]
MKEKKAYNFFTLFSLYIAQSVPMTFFSTVMPVIMRQEQYSLTSIGLLQLVKLPWILKFLWAPLVDGSSKRTIDFKKWIFSSEIVYAVLIVAIGFLNLQIDFNLIIILLLFAFTASATQDIATDAFAILILKKEDRSIGNSMQSGGSFLGTVIGSGVLLIIYSFYGWKFLMLGLAGFVFIALIPLLFFKKQKIRTEEKFKKISGKDLYLFFTQKGILKHVLLLFFFYSGIVGILTMVKPWLVDLGYNIKEIGIYSGIYGASAGFLSALFAGWLMRKIGRRKSVRIFMFLTILVTAYFVIISYLTLSTALIILALLLIWGVYGANSVAVYTLAMDNVRTGREGTDFTIQIVLTHLGSLFLAIMSGKLAYNFGYRGLFTVELIFAIFVFIFFPVLYTFNSETNDKR